VTVRRPIAVLLVALGALAPAGCSRSKGSTEAFCAQVKQVPSLESVLDRFSEADPAVLADRIVKARHAYDDLADAAPGEIRDEARDVVALVDAVLQAVEDHPTDPAAAAKQLRAEVADHPKATASRQKVAAFAQDECHVRLDPTLAPSSGAPTTTTTAAATTTTAG
jgi:hypothetical protein